MGIGFITCNLLSTLLTELPCISHEEVLAQTLLATRWAPCWQSQHVIILCDNATAVHIINKGTSAHPVVKHAPRQLFWLSAIYNFRFTAVHIPRQHNVLADSYHKPAQCLSFYKHLFSIQPHPLVDASLLTYQSLQIFFVANCLVPNLARQLEEEIFHYRSHTISDNTKATYRTHRNSYLRF